MRDRLPDGLPVSADRRLAVERIQASEFPDLLMSATNHLTVEDQLQEGLEIPWAEMVRGRSFSLEVQLRRTRYPFDWPTAAVSMALDLVVAE